MKTINYLSLILNVFLLTSCGGFSNDPNYKPLSTKEKIKTEREARVYNPKANSGKKSREVMSFPSVYEPKMPVPDGSYPTSCGGFSNDPNYKPLSTKEKIKTEREARVYNPKANLGKKSRDAWTSSSDYKMPIPGGSYPKMPVPGGSYPRGF